MAEDKKKKGANKFIKITACILFVAIVVGLIVFFIPSNKSSLIEVLAEAKNQVLLQDDENKANYSAFSVRINANPRVNIYMEEMNSISVITETFSDVVNYYNGYIKFASSNRTFKNYNGKAKSSLQKAYDSSKKLNTIISDAISLTDSKEAYLRNTWIEYRVEFLNYISCCSDAFEALYQIVNGCFEDSVSINPATKTNLLVVNSYVSVIKESFDELVDSDKLHIPTTEYTYLIGGKIGKFGGFVDKYLKNESENKKYYFDDATNLKYQTIITYLKNENFESLIQSINKSGAFEISDKTEQIEVVVKYLGG